MGGVVKDSFGIRTSFVSMGLVSLVGFLLCVILLPPTGQEKLLARARPPLRYRILIKNKYVAALFLFRVAYTACVGLVWAFLPLFAHTKYRLSSSSIHVV